MVSALHEDPVLGKCVANAKVDEEFLKHLILYEFCTGLA